MIRILITDDHVIIRQCLKHILKEEFKEVVFGEAATGQEALEKARNEIWDIIILDVGMAGKTGLSVLKQLRREEIKTPVLVMSFNSDDRYAIRALKFGASGFIAKDNAYNELIVAIRFILLKTNEAQAQPYKTTNKLPVKPQQDWVSAYENLALSFVSQIKNILKNAS